MADIFSLDNARTILAKWFPGRTIGVHASMWTYHHDRAPRRNGQEYSASLHPGLDDSPCSLHKAPTLGQLIDLCHSLRPLVYADETVDLADPAGQAIPDHEHSDSCPAPGDVGTASAGDQYFTPG